MGIVLQETLQQGKPPSSHNIQHKGRAFRGGWSLVNGSSGEDQTWLNLNALLPWVMDSYTKRMKQAFYKKARPREFQKMRLCVQNIQLDSRGKGMPNYKGWGLNIDAVKKYFVQIYIKKQLVKSQT